MAKPAVDGLEKELQGRAEVAKVDIFSESGGELADRYRVSATPTYLVLDGAGNVVYRQVGGNPDTRAIVRAVALLHGNR
ncbi:MAG TPA: thioredoxin family protein [Myxococcaceae bacterium]|nr:thioredoxin family protein [Myxococcaceae bacterium]